jgi:DNA-binding LacI/PurR family transcriptional regulator
MTARTRARGATLDTLARTLRVSRTTISNAYNRPDQLSSRLRRSVLSAARQAGYAGPDPVARTLRRGKTGALGILFDDPLLYAFTDPAAVLFLQGVAGACERAGAALLIIPRRQGGDAGQLVRGAMVDGFIAQIDIRGDERVTALEERGAPFVMVDAPAHPGAPWVGIDDRRAARRAAQHLLDLGHRRFGVIALPLSPDDREGRAPLERQAEARYAQTAERLAGYRDALEDAGIDWDEVAVEERVPHGAAAGRRAAAALLDQAERPTAILAMSDELAIGALEAAAERGIDVPGQLSVVGFDDTPAAARARPALTTVRQPHTEKGAWAARLLLEGGPRARRRRVKLPFELIVRASSGPARAAEPPASSGRARRRRR